MAHSPDRDALKVSVTASVAGAIAAKPGVAGSKVIREAGVRVGDR
ncbi:hypothetical protein [Marinobacter litoralis]|nr:hypothetical protein [Marinobacter litoralis]